MLPELFRVKANDIVAEIRHEERKIERQML